MNCNTCGVELTDSNTHPFPDHYTTTLRGVICTDCYNANSAIRLFHGEDLLDMLQRFRIGALFDCPPASDTIESINNVGVKEFVVVELEDKKGYLEFKVKADVRFKP